RRCSSPKSKLLVRSGRRSGFPRKCGSGLKDSVKFGSLIPSPKLNFNLVARSEEHTSELQSRFDLVCRLLLEKKKKKNNQIEQKKNNNDTNTETETNKHNRLQGQPVSLQHTLTMNTMTAQLRYSEVRTILPAV